MNKHLFFIINAIFCFITNDSYSCDSFYDIYDCSFYWPYSTLDLLNPEGFKEAVRSINRLAKNRYDEKIKQDRKKTEARRNFYTYDSEYASNMFGSSFSRSEWAPEEEIRLRRALNQQLSKSQPMVHRLKQSPTNADCYSLWKKILGPTGDDQLRHCEKIIQDFDIVVIDTSGSDIIRAIKEYKAARCYEKPV